MTAPKYCRRGVLAFETERGTRIYKSSKAAAGFARHYGSAALCPDALLPLYLHGTFDPLAHWYLNTARSKGTTCACCGHAVNRRTLSDYGKRRLLRLRKERKQS